MKTMTIVPIYRAKLILSVSEDVIAARKEDSEIFGPCLLTKAQAMASCDDEGNNYAIYFNYSHLDHGTIAHEIFHLTHRIFDSISGKFDINNQEPLAYLCEWLTDWVYAELEKEKLI